MKGDLLVMLIKAGEWKNLSFDEKASLLFHSFMKSQAIKNRLNRWND